MEHGLFPSEDFRQVLVPNYVEARLHNDERIAGSDDFTERALKIRELEKEMVGHFTLPYYILMDPTDRQVLGEHVLALTHQEAKLLEFLKTGADDFAAKHGKP